VVGKGFGGLWLGASGEPLPVPIPHRGELVCELVCRPHRGRP